MSLFLEDFYRRKLLGERPIAVVESPPQHGKTSATVHFLAWVLGLNPKEKILYLSSNKELGVEAVSLLHRLASSKRYRFFFGKILSSSFTQERLSTKRGGYLKAMSLGGTFVGQSADIAVIDDPYKDREEAHSEIVRQKRWRSFGTDVMSRLNDDGGVLVVSTRWHVRDLSAQIKKHHPKTLVFSYPAIACEDEKYRKKGEALRPEFKSLDFLRRQELLMSRGDFEALYQQNPGVYSEGLFKRGWFSFYEKASLPLSSQSRLFVTVDTAFKTGESHDYSVFLLWAKEADKIYLLEALRGKWEAPELFLQMKTLMERHPEAIAYIEDKASGIGLVQEARRVFEPYRVAAMGRRRGKIQRALDVLSFAASGKVFLPKDEDFTETFLSEVLEFNALMTHERDDITDAFVDALGIAFLEDEADLTLKKWASSVAGD